MLKESTVKKLNEYAEKEVATAKKLNPNAEVELVNIPLIIVRDKNGKVCCVTSLNNEIIPLENE